MKHAGADWLYSAGVKEISDFGKQVADLVGCVFQGIYHISDEALKVDWKHTAFIQISLPRQQFATFDANLLTILVVLAHDQCIRVSIHSRGMNTLLLTFHPRKREGGYSERHPTLEEHVKQIREYYA